MEPKNPKHLTASQAKMLRTIAAGVETNWAPSYRQTLRALERLRFVHKVFGASWQITDLGRVALEEYKEPLS